MSTKHKKHQIIFVIRMFARDKTQLIQGLATPIDWKCYAKYSSSLILKITICSVFSKKTSVEILTGSGSIFIKKLYNMLSTFNQAV